MLKIKVDGVVELLYVYYSMYFKYEQIELLLCGKTSMGRIKVNTKRRLKRSFWVPLKNRFTELKYSLVKF